MDRPSSSTRHGKLDFVGDAPEVSDTEAKEAEATRDLLRVGAHIVLVVGCFFALSVCGCMSCIVWGPDHPGPSQSVLHPSAR